MANRSQGATAAAAAAGDNGHDDDDAVVCLDGTTTTEGLSSLYSYVPTQDEIRTALKSTKIVGTMDKKKQELAAAGLDPMRSAILRRLNNKDKTAFETALPIKNPAKAGDPCELKLSSAVSVATSWMAASAIVLRLINDTTKWSRRDGTALRAQLCVVSDTLEVAIEAAKTQVLKDKQAKVKAAMVDLSLADLPTSVGWCRGNWMAPPDPAHATCMFCTHVSIDVPKDLAVRQTQNEAALRKYTADKKAFEEAKAGNPDATRTAAKGGKTARAPARPKLKHMTARCACRSFNRPKAGSDVGSTCPILCVNQETGTAYKDDGPGGTECPYCKCQCTAAYDLTKIHLIGPGIALSQGEEAPSHQARQLALQSSAATVGGIMVSAVGAAQKEFTARPRWQTASMAPEDLQQEGRDLPPEIAAAQIAKTMAQDQHLPWVQEARSAIAPNGLSSVAHLPGGRIVDARTYGSSRSSHRESTNSLFVAAKDTTKAPVSSSKSKAKAKAKAKSNDYHPFGRPPVVTKTKTTTSNTYSFNGLMGTGLGGGPAKSVPAITFNNETTTTSMAASAAVAVGGGGGGGGATIDLTTSSPVKDKSTGLYQLVSSSSSSHTSTVDTPKTSMGKRVKKRLIASSCREVDYVDVENDDVVFKDETERKKKKRMRNKATFNACAKNPEAFEDIIEDAVARRGIDDSQQVVYSLHDLMSDE